jgi:hypothetical protein
VGIGEGMASAEGHSLNLAGFVLDGLSETRRFCDGHLRIQERTTKDKSRLGVAQIADIENSPYLSAALIVERNEFSDIREILIRDVGNLRICLEDIDCIGASELARTKTVVTLVSASVSGLYVAAKSGRRA